jgi:regulator of sigma E protease
VAGPTANFVLALMIFVFIYMFVGKDMTPAIIHEVQKDSPAHISGIKKNDKIVSIDNKKVNSILEVSTFISTSTLESIELIILRNSHELIFNIKPDLVESKDSFGNKIKKRMIGIKLAPFNNEFNNVKLGPTEAIFYSVKEIFFVIVTSLKYLGSMITGSGDSSQLGGPIRIAKITGQVAEYGIVPFLSVMAYISISLGLINLFPIPMLDGGHLMFYFFEKLLGRPLRQKTQEGFFRIGLFLLFSLMLFASFNDLKNLGLF